MSKIKENKKTKKVKKDKREIIIKTVAFVMALMMVFAVAATLIFYLEYGV